jgi:hypothetical protein
MELRLEAEMAIWKVVLKVTPTERPVLALAFMERKPKK